MDTEFRIERIAKGLPDASDVYIDPELTNVAVSYVQDDQNFIARQMLGAVPVQKQTGKFPSFSKADYQRDEMTERADGKQSAVAGFRETFLSYACTVFSLATDVGPQRRANSPAADVNATRFLMKKGLLKTEVQFGAACWGTGLWTTEWTGVASPSTSVQFLKWTDASADPINDLEGIIQAYEIVAAGFPINRLAFSADVWRTFKNHPNVIARFNAGQTPGGGAKVTRQSVADLLEIESIQVAKAVKTTTGPGVAEASSTFGRILGTGVLGLHASPTPSVDEPSAGYHFDWTGYAGAGAQGQAIFQEPVPNTRGAIRHEIEYASQVNLVAKDLGFWLQTPLG